MKVTFHPKGVCSKQFDIELQDGVITSFNSDGGCRGNLGGIGALLTGRKAEEVIPLLKGMPCGLRSTSCPDQIAIALKKALDMEAEEHRAKTEKVYSAKDMDIDCEYMWYAYPSVRKENDPDFGAEKPSDIRIRPITFDELCYSLHADGTRMFLFGGPWSEKTNAVISKINFLAEKYGVDTVYTFDFVGDSVNPRVTFKTDITAQQSYDGPGKEEPLPYAECNFIYGELCSRHLTNLNDWVQGKAGSGHDITWLNVYDDTQVSPRLEEPFLFLFDKHNTADHAGAGSAANEKGAYPIIAAMELSGEETVEQLENGIFGKISEYGLNLVPYTVRNYMYDAFKKNKRGHAFKTEDAFRKDEQINVRPVTLPELRWLMDQNGSFVIMFGGPWCAFSSGAVPTLNDYAVANGVTAFMFDGRLDGKHPIDFWMYPRGKELTMSKPELRKYTVEIWEKRIPGAPVTTGIDPEAPAWAQKVTYDYVDEEGNTHTLLATGVPYIFAYDKNHRSREGRRSPLLQRAGDSGELINCTEGYVYYDPNYRPFKASMYSVFYNLCADAGYEFHDTEVDRTAPIAEGEMERHKPTVAYHKKHDWWKERGEGKANTETVSAEILESYGCN